MKKLTFSNPKVAGCALFCNSSVKACMRLLYRKANLHFQLARRIISAI